MRRLLFTLIAGSALFAAALPATVMAHSHHGRRTRHRAVRHGRIRHERFGSSSAQTSPAGQTSGDGQNAGTVTSVQNNRVTITLNNADRSTVTGMLTRATEIKCEAPQQDQMQTEDRGDGGGDNCSGDNSGDDNGDAGDDQGEEQAQMCTLATGMVVRHAELDVSSAGAVWHEIEAIS
jgi:hypothetical protein